MSKLGLKVDVWNGKDLEGEWEVTSKLDGVCVIYADGKAYTKGGILITRDMPVLLEDGVYELYLSSWNESVSAIAASSRAPIFQRDLKYLGDGTPSGGVGDWFDKEIIVDPSSAIIESLMKDNVSEGYEGIVLHNKSTGKRLKAKPHITIDTIIIGYTEGKGKYVGKLGKIHTPFGDCGSGFSDAQRKVYWQSAMDGRLLGRWVEIRCDALTENNKFRFPRFERFRPDKDTIKFPSAPIGSIDIVVNKIKKKVESNEIS